MDLGSGLLLKRTSKLKPEKREGGPGLREVGGNGLAREYHFPLAWTYSMHSPVHWSQRSLTIFNEGISIKGKRESSEGKIFPDKLHVRRAIKKYSSGAPKTAVAPTQESNPGGKIF